MKTLIVVLFSTLTLTAPLAFAHPDHDSLPGIKGLRTAPAPAVDKPYGRPGDTGQPTRTVSLDINDKMRFTPADIKVKQGETIKFVVKNSAKTPQVMAFGTPGELKERAAMLAQFPKMEMNQANQVSVKPGESAQLVWQFTKAGEFAFASTSQVPHEAGMIGKIVVVE